MFAFKFVIFDFKQFMIFVLNLVDYYGLDEVRFCPDYPDFFNDQQLTHISPSRDVNDPRGFVGEWQNKQEEVRRVEVKQFSRDKSKAVDFEINLDKKMIHVTEVRGIAQSVVEDLILKNFGYEQTITDIKLEKLQMRMKVLEFISVFFISICLTLIMAVVDVNLIKNNSVVTTLFLINFGLIMTILYIVLPIIETIKRIGLSIKNIYQGSWVILRGIKVEYDNASKLTKFGILIAISSLLVGFISLLR